MITDMVMIDLETFSTRPTAAIASIGAVKFTESGIRDKFYVNIDPKSCKELGLHFSKETLEWWANQSKEARDALKVDRKSINEAIEMFINWYGSKSLKTWSNGADFDLPILSYAMLMAGYKAPWKYWDGMCVRTITTLTGQKIPRDAGVSHNALDDAANQAEYIIKFMRGNN